MDIGISESARKFIEEMGISDVTFRLVEHDVRGAMGIIKDIMPAYEIPEDATRHKFFRIDEFCIFIDRNIRITGPLVLKTEGFLKKRLALGGVKPPFFNFGQ